MSRLDPKYRYYAFISYNHKDEREAKWLQRQLEHYRLPSVARKEIGEDVKIRPVFRYAVNLSLGDLRRQVKEELDASKFLIVICSPNSAQPNIEGRHWVNDEVTRFIETGRADSIIPVIVDGEPNVGGERECFPPALRNMEIAGANLSKGSRSERRNDFLKIVAKLLGILPDQLIRHTDEEERQAKAHFGLKLLPLAILLAVGGLFAWDATRTVSNYYADYVDSFGLPEGIFPLKKSDTAHRNAHYRFEYHGFQFGKSPHADSADWCIWKMLGLRRRLVRVVQANSHGLPCKRWQPEYDRPQMQDFTYDNKLRLCEIRHGRYNGEGREPYLEKRIELSTEKGVVNGLLQFFSSKGRLDKTYVTASTTWAEDSFFSANFSAKSEITQHLVKRDPRGRVEQLLFLNSSGANVPDGDGLYGFGYEYDDLGRQTAQWYLFRDGSEFLRHPNKKGVAGQRYEYLGRNMRKIEYVNLTGSPVMGPHGWMVLSSAFDENDNVIKSLRYDERGNIMSEKDGYAEVRIEYDERGNRTKVKYFGVDGEPVPHVNGYAGWEAGYDELGRKVRQTWLGVDGKPTLHKDGYAELRFEYDARGNMTKAQCFGVDGKPALHKDGYAEVGFKYDARGNMTKELCFGVDGKPALHKDGYAEVGFKYDARGNMTKELCFGVDGTPALHKDGYAEVSFEYDARGNRTKESYVGVDGKPTLHKDGYAEVSFEYDARGIMAKKSYFGVDGKPTLYKDGCAAVSFEHDARGNVTKVQYFGVDGKLTLNKDGYAEVRMDGDARGNMTKAQFFDVDGKPTLHKDGYAEVRSEYDARGNMTKAQFFDVDGRPTPNKDGYAEVRSEYDARGNLTKSQCFGMDGRPTPNKDGYAEVRREYNAHGNETRRLFLGVDGKPTLHKDGYAELRGEYDAHGNRTKTQCFGVDGKPKAGVDGIAEIHWEYDARGNVTNESYFGIDGKPKADEEGVFEKRHEYDQDGKKRRQSWVYADADGTMSREDGIAEEHIECDARGDVTRVQRFGVDGKPKADKDGVFELRFEYGQDGKKRRLSLIYVDADGMMSRDDGIAEKCFEYGTRGNVTRIQNFGVDGKPVLNKIGFAEMRVECDERGNEKRRLFFGVKGELIQDGKPSEEGSRK